MEQTFWQERWDAGRLGFHLDAANPNLEKFGDRLGPKAGDGCLLAPLCGKTHDLIYLARQGFTVHGVEFIEQAVRDFFLENDLLFQEFPDGCFQGLSPGIAERITMWRCDFFRIRRDELPMVTAVYDRAALVALPPDLRPEYAEHLTRLTVPGALQLLISFDYDQAEMPGPPHSVPPAEVDDLYSKDWTIEPLDSQDILNENQRFADQGMTRLEETVYLMRRRG